MPKLKKLPIKKQNGWLSFRKKPEKARQLKHNGTDSNPSKFNRRIFLKSLLPLAAILTAIAAFLLVAVKSDYNEGGIFLFGLLIVVFVVALFWDTARSKLRLTILFLLILTMAFSGNLFVRAGKYQSRVNEVVAWAVVHEAGTILRQWADQGKPLPDCNWYCLRDLLNGWEGWKGVSLQYQGADKTLDLRTFPKRDGWGCRFFYKNQGAGRFIVRSSGADRKFYTGDDLIFDSENPNDGPPPKVPVFPNGRTD